jgi:hypothetical protein
MSKQIEVDQAYFQLLEKIAQSVSKLPFGESIALPWCRESFPELDLLMLIYEKKKEPKIKRVDRDDMRCPNCNSADVRRRLGTCGSWYCPSCESGRRL